ncbi:hypothetical protein SKAU_G00253420 [Synaphobranchus kaupii]|uniref:C-type lectin domain-containing protein n=1 Tax=Synaphobranchus kaupii TaxID=118154 RepID=A0A9Q1IS44_SYNKA|nr:hypothetical protein SKAU_G00253420 [Synaphobranchus kaupii]
MESKKWHRFPFLCQIVAFTLYYERCYAGDCPADGRTWVPFEQSCYHFVHGEENIAQSYTYQSAKEICRGYGLLRAKSAEVNNFIVQYSPEVWKGNINMWLDMNFNPDNNSLMWNDNTGLTFVNWDRTFSTTEFASMDICAALHSSTGMWEQVSCLDDIENGVVCETAQKSEKQNSNNSPLLTALVVLSVLIIVGVSAVLWFLHQRHDFSTIFTSFEYHPPFRSPTADEATLVDSEETEDMA